MLNSARIPQIALLSIFVALGVFGIKIVAWKISGSVALYSDALESVVNVVAATIAWFAIRISHKPSDKEHQFGHHKAEYFSAIFEGILIVVAALLIFREAYQALSRDYTVEAPALAMLVNALAAGINGVWGWFLISTGKRAQSPALSADGRHLLTDVVTSIGVLFGLFLAVVTGWIILDAVMAILVGLNILWEGGKIVYLSVNGLMDVSVDTKQSELIETTILANASGAIEVHDIKTRVAGPVTFIEFHLIVEGTMSVAASHEICDRIETQLKKAVSGAQTTIHVEPDHERKDDGLGVS